jgi:hypothetical protein
MPAEALTAACLFTNTLYLRVLGLYEAFCLEAWPPRFGAGRVSPAEAPTE